MFIKYGIVAPLMGSNMPEKPLYEEHYRFHQWMVAQERCSRRTVRIHVDHAEGDLDRLGIREPGDSDPAVIRHEGNSRRFYCR